ncbi:MAG TPA: SDR family oxidoreductase [Bryobacteraceae bacterium]|nr:SDR family oxidoreductase [Bryobacteraceae bacterium]
MPAERPLAAITGASSGIGATFARKLAPDHDLLLIARRLDRLKQLAGELSSQYGTHAECLEADLTQERNLATVAEKLAAEERLVLLVNNAGFGTPGRFWEADLQSQEGMHKLHVTATLRLTHVVLGGMVARDRGAVVNVASVAAFIRSARSASYCATKSWMAVFTEALYLELRSVGSNVAVQALCPGFTYSEFHDVAGMDRRGLAPAAFWLTAEEVVEASLDGLRRGKLFVIPGWRYRFLTSLLTKLPTPWRLAVEARASKARGRAVVAPERHIPPSVAPE